MTLLTTAEAGYKTSIDRSDVFVLAAQPHLIVEIF